MDKPEAVVAPCTTQHSTRGAHPQRSNDPARPLCLPTFSCFSSFVPPPLLLLSHFRSARPTNQAFPRRLFSLFFCFFCAQKTTAALVCRYFSLLHSLSSLFLVGKSRFWRRIVASAAAPVPSTGTNGFLAYKALPQPFQFFPTRNNRRNDRLHSGIKHLLYSRRYFSLVSLTNIAAIYCALLRRLLCISLTGAHHRFSLFTTATSRRPTSSAQLSLNGFLTVRVYIEGFSGTFRLIQGSDCCKLDPVTLRSVSNHIDLLGSEAFSSLSLPHQKSHLNVAARWNIQFMALSRQHGA